MKKLLSIDNKHVDLLLPGIALTLIVFRDFDLFIHPRFWAEEGSVYFLDAYVNGAKALLHPHQGYYSLVPSFGTYLATFASLDNAPVVTTVLALCIHLIPFLLICFSKSRFLDTSFKKFLFSSAVLFICHTGEIALNVITSQFHFVVIAFLVLLESGELMGKRREFLLYSLTLLAGLSGVPGNILAPVFLYDYFRRGNKVCRNIFLIFVFTTAIQIVYIFIVTKEHLERYGSPESRVFTDIIVNFLNYPIFYKSGYLTLTSGMLLVIPLFFIVIEAVRRKRDYLLFFASSLLLNIVMMFTSLEMAGGARYVYAPSVIFVFGLITLLFDDSFNRKLRAAVLAYVLIAFANSIWLYFPEEGRFNSKNWKKWEDQVRLFENHQVDELVIYPQWNDESWKIHLPKK